MDGGRSQVTGDRWYDGGARGLEPPSAAASAGTVATTAAEAAEEARCEQPLSPGDQDQASMRTGVTAEARAVS